MTTNRKTGSYKIFQCSFLIPFFMVQIFWAICGMYPFGDNSILTGDMNVEFVNFYAYFINTLKTNNDWSYMLTKTLGVISRGLRRFSCTIRFFSFCSRFPGIRSLPG